MSTSPYERLRKTQLKDLTQTLVSNTMKEAFIQEQNGQVAALEASTAIHGFKLAQSTFGSNSIPDTGAISATNLPNDTAVNVQPSAGEVWSVNGIFDVFNADPANPAEVIISLYDGTNEARQFSSTVAGNTRSLVVDMNQMQLTNTQYLRLSQDGNSTSVTISFGYTKLVI